MNYAILVDLNSMRLSYESFAKAIASIDGKIAYAKLYGYNNKRNNDFNAFIKTYGVEVALPVSNRKKVRIDIRQVIDAVTIACTRSNVDAFFIICSELDSIAMINALKKLGKRVIMGIESPSFVAEQCDGYVMLERTLPDEDVKKPAVWQEAWTPGSVRAAQKSSISSPVIRQRVLLILPEMVSEGVLIPGCCQP